MRTRALWVVVALLAVLTPLGLWLPQRLGAREAWGEWAPEEVGRQLGFVPRGLGRLADLWKAPIPDYAPRGWEARPFLQQGLAYVFSALLGIAVCAAAIWVLGRVIARRERSDAP
jgi:hypothetical protein